MIPSWLYRRSVVIDGNFASEHLKMRRPDDDVALTDGDGYFVSVSDYETHLAETSETKQVECYSTFPYFHTQFLVIAIYLQ
jgi:hypothetical protein